MEADVPSRGFAVKQVSEFLRVLTVAFTLYWTAGEANAQQPAASALTGEALAAELSQRYGIALVYREENVTPLLAGKSIKGSVARKKDLESYLSILKQEWSLYPRELVEKTKLKRLILCSDLAWDGQQRTAIPDFGGDALYLDVSRGRGHDDYVRKVIHHEYFHIIDWRDDGRLYQDAEWTALNSPGFKYGRGGAAVQDDSSVSLPNDTVAGFVDKYAASGVEEDKAELYSYLLVTPGVLEPRLKTDTILQAKVARMKELLASFCAKADGAFWDAARKLRVKKN
jgi:hypothetical protein